MMYTAILHRSERLQDPGGRGVMPSCQDVYVARVEVPGVADDQRQVELVKKVAIQMALEEDGEGQRGWLDPNAPPIEDDYTLVAVLAGHPKFWTGWQFDFGML